MIYNAEKFLLRCISDGKLQPRTQNYKAFEDISIGSIHRNWYMISSTKRFCTSCLTSLPTQDLRNWEILEYFQKRENAEPSTLPSRNKILILLVVKNYAKADINKVFLSCPILFDLLILFHKLCQRLKIHLTI